MALSPRLSVHGCPYDDVNGLNGDTSCDRQQPFPSFHGHSENKKKKIKNKKRKKKLFSLFTVFIFCHLLFIYPFWTLLHFLYFSINLSYVLLHWRICCFCDCVIVVDGFILLLKQLNRKLTIEERREKERKKINEINLIFTKDVQFYYVVKSAD